MVHPCLGLEPDQTRPPHRRKQNKTLEAYLNQQLQEWDLTGSVVTVLARDGHGKINNYGLAIKDGRIFSEVKMLAVRAEHFD